LLERAVAWRAGRVESLDPAGARGEWRTATGAWVAAWRAWGGDSYDDALRAARRARLRRRLRRALSWPTRSGLGPPLVARLRHALGGTPQHRVNASAVVLLLAAAEGDWSGVEPPLPARASRALVALGAAGAASRADWPAAARAVVGAWDRWVLDGQRTAEPA
jgi:hypothetical protein